MTKPTKEKLSLDELLEQALVKEQDIPYKVPENWVWTYVINLFDNLTNSNKKIKQRDYLGNGEYAIIDQGKELIGGYTNNKNLLFDGKLPIVVFGDHTRIIKYIDFPFVQGADGVKILKPLRYIDNKFFYYLLNNINIPNLGYRRHFPIFPTLICPLPPFAEQQRIVKVINLLFEKLDAAKELVENALDSFENRKASILHKAFTGELTAKWRKENGISLDSWQEKKLKELCKISSGGTPSRTKKEYYNGKIPWIKTGEINWNCINDSEEKITECAVKNSSAKLFPIGTVIVAMYGQGLTRGRSAILNIESATNQAVCALIPNTKLINKYLYYYFMCNYWKFREKAIGGNQPNLSGTIISRFIINIPSIKEQQEIVRILDNILLKEQQAKELCDVIEKIDLMKKAILAKAFRGELGTNNPYEESALELLKQVLNEKIK